MPTQSHIVLVAAQKWGEVPDMLGKFGAASAGISDAADAGDTRSAALLLMSEALARLDSDHNIPAVIGAHLQSAIDALWTSGTTDQSSANLH